jgi:hypothetical protein
MVIDQHYGVDKGNWITPVAAVLRDTEVTEAQRHSDRRGINAVGC